MFGIDALLGIGGKLISNSFFCAQSSTQSQINCIVRKPSFVTPFLNGLFFIKCLNKTRISSIFCLLKSINPTTIFGIISFIIVNSFNAQSNRSFSHIKQKVFKFQPSFTNSNTPTTIIFKRFTFWRKTSFFDAFPNLIC